MAERSSELDETTATVAETESGATALERRDEESALSETDDRDIKATDTDDADAPDDARQIRDQIEEIRSQMSETIDAIQEKLSIANITEQVKEQVTEQIGGAVESAKDAFFDKTGAVAKTIGRSLGQVGNSDLVKKAKENPWTFSVVGMGIGAVLIGVFFGGKSKKKAKYRYKNFAGERKAKEKRYTEQTRQKFESGAARELNYQTADEADYQTTRNKVGETANKTSENIGSKASAAFAGISSAAGSAYENVGGAASKTYESVGKASSYAYEKAGDLGEEMKKNYEHYIEENPLVVGAVAFAVGAAIGYAIPSTKVENQYLGEMRDNVVDKAQASAQDAIGTVKQVVGEAQQMIVDEVKSQTAS